jgi:copper transport protein
VIYSRKIFFFLIVALTILVFSFPGLSSAHAYIVKSFPSENQALNKSPNKVSIEFDEIIQPTFYSIQVLDMRGTQVNSGKGYINSSNGKILESDLQKELPKGIYSIKWRVVSGDGHPIDGLIPFQIGVGSKNQTLLKSKTTGYVPHFDLVLLRLIQYVSGAIFVGLTFFYLSIYPRESLRSTSIEKRYKSVIHLSFVFLWLSILFSLPLQATIEANVSWLNAFDFSILRDVATKTLSGKVWIAQIALLTLLLLTIKRNEKLFLWWASFVLGSCLFLAKAITSHAVATNNLLVDIEFDFLHLLSVSIWIGSLVALVVLLPLNREEEGKLLYQQIVRRFSTWGKVLVFLLVISGVYLSLTYIPTFHALFYTNYGRVLIGKVVLFFIMLVFAWLNSSKGRKSGAEKWGSTLWGELATGVIVLVLAVILTNLPTAASSLGPFKETKSFNNKDTVMVKVGPNVIGQNTFDVILKDKTGKPLTEVQQVSLTFSTERMDMGEYTVNIPKVAEGHFKDRGMYFNMTGKWNVHVHVLTKSLEALDTDFTCVVGSQ